MSPGMAALRLWLSRSRQHRGQQTSETATATTTTTAEADSAVCLCRRKTATENQDQNQNYSSLPRRNSVCDFFVDRCPQSIDILVPDRGGNRADEGRQAGSESRAEDRRGEERGRIMAYSAAIISRRADIGIGLGRWVYVWECDPESARLVQGEDAYIFRLMRI